jgi:stalled ribosome rescue protein Dom34
MNAHHAVIWIDHNEARIFRFVGEDQIEKLDLHSHQHGHVHNKHTVSGRRSEDHEYLRAVVDAVKDAEEFLVVGPGSAKLELIRVMHKDHHELEKRLVAVETIDHPTDGQLLAYARKYFRKVDALR